MYFVETMKGPPRGKISVDLLSSTGFVIGFTKLWEESNLHVENRIRPGRSETLQLYRLSKCQISPIPVLEF